MANQGRHDPEIVVATGRRSVCLNKGRFSNNVAQIPYRGIAVATGRRSFSYAMASSAKT